jgi:hypothetical protein
MGGNQRQLNMGHQAQVHSDQRFLWWPGREAGPHERWLKTLKLSQISSETARLESTQIRLFSWKSGREAGLDERWPRTLKCKSENNFRQPRGLLKQVEWQPNTKRVKMLFFWGCWRGEMLKMMLMMRWESLCCHRSVRQQLWGLKNFLSELSIYSSPLISVNEVWGGRWSTRYLHIDSRNWISRS